ncbi:YdeI/OmpD-associated family protein [Paenibacillus oenotherae]|uniref:YdeI/OmpD-associated family protein n=1 Tax=Paenibacillus oenotherae TaxID=1435645 RepID=A0ABS7D919_9BACL|nr:YdeI/OmpD-associated family protein [Paenibacillus oenotherae]MBW7476263.1 YdeI/OmpD-associated family protein [Paenibacillus oenotherae]
MNIELMKKLKLSHGISALVLQPPYEAYVEELELGEESTVYDKSKAGTYDFVQLFAKDIADLEEHAPEALEAVKRDGLLWICYPKGTSKLKSDLNRDRGWKSVHDEGWEGIALISIDDTWSAMRLRPKDAIKSGAGSRRASSSKSDRAASSEQDLVVPQDLTAAFANAPEAEAFFTGLAPSHRKEYIRWINESVKEETRANRIVGTIEKLQGKLKRPSDKG